MQKRMPETTIFCVSGMKTFAFLPFYLLQSYNLPMSRLFHENLARGAVGIADDVDSLHRRVDTASVECPSTRLHRLLVRAYGFNG